MGDGFIWMAILIEADGTGLVLGVTGEFALSTDINGESRTAEPAGVTTQRICVY